MSHTYKNLFEAQDRQQEVQHILFEIANCLGKDRIELNYRIVIAAYLLYKCSNFKNPASIHYQDIFSKKLAISREILLSIKERIDDQEWERLKSLLTKYPPDLFALAALSGDLTANSKMGTMTTPESIIRLAQEVLSIQENDKVADIGCGYGGFLNMSAIAFPYADYRGYEINVSNAIIASIRAELIGNNIQIVLQDAFQLLENGSSLKFDKIFSNYPFGIQLRSLSCGMRFIDRLVAENPGLSKATSSDWIFNALLCNLLAENGKAVGIMTNGGTWNSIDTPIRKYFLEQGFVEAVISLPARMFNVTSIPTSMIILSRNNKSVRLVDASKLCQRGRRFNEFSDEDIHKIITALKKDSKISKVIHIEDLRKNEYTLSFSRYLESEITFENAVPFESVVKSITRGASCTASQLDKMVSDNITKMQYLMLANIQDGMIDNKLPYLSRIDAKYEKYCLKNNDLILSKNGYPYKVAVATVQEGQKILANGNLYIIELDEEKVNPYYLKAFFESELGIATLKSITVGATIPSIGVEKLKKVNIPLPSLEEQKRVAEKYQSTMDEIAILKLRIEKATDRLHHIFDEGDGEK